MRLKHLSTLKPMVVKIVGSTPTARTIDESEVVGVLDTEQNKQNTSGECEQDRVDHYQTWKCISPSFYYKLNTIIDG